MVLALKMLAFSVLIVALSFAILLWKGVYRPDPLAPGVLQCANPPAPALKPGQRIRILSWNVQFMAGKNYVFFFDMPDDRGPHKRPSRPDIERTLQEVARVIDEENPDIVLLQEVDDGAARTDHEDQQEKLQGLLKHPYPCQASAFYWKAAFVPHPNVWGSVGMKLTTLSRFQLLEAKRHALPEIPHPWIKRQFYLKRAVLETPVATESRTPFTALNTHLDAFAQGTDTMARQVQTVMGILDRQEEQGKTWIIGGDFNLLPPGAWELLPEFDRESFEKETELRQFFEKYSSVPALQDATGPEREKWFTHFPNDPRSEKPDRTIDYIFISPGLKVLSRRVRSGDTLEISDHFPVIVEVEVP